VRQVPRPEFPSTPFLAGRCTVISILHFTEMPLIMTLPCYAAGPCFAIVLYSAHPRYADHIFDFFDLMGSQRTLAWLLRGHFRLVYRVGRMVSEQQGWWEQ